MRVRPKDRAKWERWFAWHPIIVDNVTVWFEVVERRRYPDIFDWVYSYKRIDRRNRGIFLLVFRLLRIFRILRRPVRGLAHLWRA